MAVKKVRLRQRQRNEELADNGDDHKIALFRQHQHHQQQNSREDNINLPEISINSAPTHLAGNVTTSENKGGFISNWYIKNK